MPESRVKDGDIVVGNPLPWPVYDKAGLLLLKKGYVIHSDQQLSMLMSRGMYTTGSQVDEAKNRLDEDTNPFEQLGSISNRIKQLFSGLYKANPHVCGALDRLANDIQSICLFAPDALLGAVHLWQDTHPLINIALDTAILSESTGKYAKLSEPNRRDLISAALVNNAANNQIAKFVQANPVAQDSNAAIVLAQQCGIANEPWFDFIRQHHRQRAGECHLAETTQATQLLNLSFYYANLIQPPKRKGANPVIAALPKLLPMKDKLFEESMLARFVHLLDTYPPGSFVQLINNETAVVVQRGSQKKRPKVATVINAKGAPCVTPMRRDSAQPNYAVKQLTQLSKPIRLNLASIWGYTAHQ